MTLRAPGARLAPYGRAFRLVWTAARGWTTLWLLLVALQGLLPGMMLYVTRLLVDALVATVREAGRGPHLGATFGFAGLMGGLMLLVELARAAAEWVRAVQGEIVQDHISDLIHEKALAVDLAFYEAPEYYDHLHLARTESLGRPVQLLEHAGSLLQSSLSLLATFAVLFTFGWWLPLGLLASGVPALALVLLHGKRLHEWQLRNTPRERLSWYYDWLLATADTAAELRLFGHGDYFRTAFRGLRKELRAGRMALLRSQAAAELGATALGMLIAAGALAMVAWQAITGLTTLGHLAMLYQAFQQSQRLMRAALDSLRGLYSNGLFLGNLFAFLDLQPQLRERDEPLPVPLPPREGIRFRDVTFRYPATDRVALREFNLRIPAGKIVAIVGPNGAGKSTLLKLLCRFCDPLEGQVEIDGVDLRDVSLNGLRAAITVLFQQPVRYSAPAGENIRFGNLSLPPGAPEIEAAARQSGAHGPLSRLPEGYGTLLGKWFGGAELSGGEWQRLALARAFLRQAPLILLDEPTSAMDSWAEAEWLERFVQLARGRTCVLITHRFTTAMKADVIHVLSEGQVVESGTHDELMALGGLYAASWTEQVRAGSAPLLRDVPTAAPATGEAAAGTSLPDPPPGRSPA